MKELSRLTSSIPRRTFPFSVLVRHFFVRLFQNDFVSFEEQMKEKTISILALIAILTAHVANSILMKYMFVADEGASWLEKCFFASFIMLILGFITIFEWDVLFPDSRDFINLMVLPIRLRTIFVAKFMSLCGFVGLFALGANVLASLPFWFYLPKWQAANDFGFFTRFLFVHLFSMLAASFFIFFLAVFLIGILMLILPEKLFRALSLVVRTLLMIFFVSALIYVVSATLTGSQAFQYLEGLKSDQSPFFYLFPPVWFTGLYETLLGNADPQFRLASSFAWISLVFVTFGFFVTSALVYRKYSRSAEAKKKARFRRFLGFRQRLSRIFNSLVLHNSIQRGIFYFFGKTLRRSMVHKMRLATFAAVGLAFGLILMAMNIHLPVFFSEPNRSLLSIPLILSYFLLVGLRNIVNIPFRLDANWIFVMTEDRSLHHYAVGLQKGIVFFLLLPLSSLVTAFSVFLWGWTIGLLHGVFGLVMSVLLSAILFLNYHKIPFACAYLPGQARAHIFWPLYIVSFLGYVSLSAKLEMFLLERPAYFLIFAGFGIGLISFLRIYQSRLVRRKKTLVYSEEPEPALVTLLTYSHK